MENDSSAGEDRASLDFELDINDQGNNLTGDNNKNTHGSPNETAGNLSNDLGELGSSCGSSNLLTMKSSQESSKHNHITSASPNDGELLGPPPQEEDASKTLEQPAASSSFNPLGTPENQQAAEGSSQTQLDSTNPNDINISRNENNNRGTSDPSVVNAPNLLRLDLETPSISTPQPDFSRREHQEPGSGGNTESYPSHANFGQNLMQFAHSHVDPLYANNTNAGQTRTSSFVQNPAQQFPPITAKTVLRNGVGQPFPPEHDPNWMSLNQFNAQSQNAFQTGLHLPHPRMADQLNQISTPIYATSVPQASEWRGMVDGRPSWITQQQPTWLSPDQSALYRPLTQAGPQHMATNVFDLQHSNSMLPGTSLPFRPQQPSMQQRNQVPAAVPNVYDPQSHYTMYPSTMLPDPSLSLRPPEFPYAYHQVPAALDSSNPSYYQSLLQAPSFPSRWQLLNGCGQQFLQNCNARPLVLPLSRPAQLFDNQPHCFQASIAHSFPNPQHHLPEPTMVSRPQSLHDRQHNPLGQVQMPPKETYSQHSCFIQPGSLAISRDQHSSDHGRIDQADEISNLADMQQDHPIPSTSFRLQTEQPLRLLERTDGTSAANLYLDTCQRSQILNSEAQQDTGDQNTEFRVMCRLGPEASLSNSKEKGILGQRCHGKSRFEIGESSASKRSKRNSLTPHEEKDQSALSPQLADRTASSHESEALSDGSNPSKLRFIQNAVYDPLFEGIGLPIDPHLRMFSLI